MRIKMEEWTLRDIYEKCLETGKFMVLKRYLFGNGEDIIIFKEVEEVEV